MHDKEHSDKQPIVGIPSDHEGRDWKTRTVHGGGAGRTDGLTYRILVGWTGIAWLLGVCFGAILTVFLAMIGGRCG